MMAETEAESPLMRDTIRTARELGMAAVAEARGGVGVALRVAKRHRRGAAPAMERAVGEMLSLGGRYGAPFAEMVSKIDSQRECASLPETFTNVVAGLLSDGQHNWGRVVAVYVLAEQLARRNAEMNRPDRVDLVGRLAGDVVAQRMGPWIADQGGWEAFEAAAPAPANQRRASKALLAISSLALCAAGLGALAAAVMAR